MHNVARQAAGAAAACAALALVAVVHHRLFGLRPSVYLTLATMLLMYAIGLLVGGGDAP